MRLVEREMTIFLSSHLLHEVEQVCTHMAIINRGKLMVQGEVKSLMERSADVTLVQVDKPQEALALLRVQSWISSVKLESSRLKVKLPLENIPQMNALLVSSGFQVSALYPRRSLEQYFLSLIGGESFLFPSN